MRVLLHYRLQLLHFQILHCWQSVITLSAVISSLVATDIHHSMLLNSARRVFILETKSKSQSIIINLQMIVEKRNCYLLLVTLNQTKQLIMFFFLFGFSFKYQAQFTA